MSSGSTLPAPFSVSPSWSWDGDDGSWSTFTISVGTPPQSFRVLPSTIGSETWIPVVEGCADALAGISNCGTLRGVDYIDGASSRGFDSASSSTWHLTGLYELGAEQNLWGPTGNQGIYGQDTVSLSQYPSGSSPRLTDQTVAGVVTANVWMGVLGMGTAAANFSVDAKNTPSLLESMRTQNMTPSVSFGYTAGASYAKTPGSLILGGYDQARFKSSDISFPISVTGKQQTLPVNIDSIVAEDVFGGTMSLSSGTPISAIIDSTVSQLWLPQSVCDKFEQAFALQLDPISGFYLVNRTIHKELVQMNPTVTFTLGAGSSSSTTNIVFQYAAFDLKAGLPLFNASTNYFPLCVAANESQQVLGRAFMQEAYVFVDWERQNFTIGQAIHQNQTTSIVPVLSPTTNVPGSDTSGLSTGAIVGIAVGGVVVIALIIGLSMWYILRSRRRNRPIKLGETTSEHRQDDDDDAKPLELMTTHVYEMEEAGSSKHELSSERLAELQADSLERELEDTSYLGGKVDTKKTWSIYEMP